MIQNQFSKILINDFDYIIQESFDELKKLQGSKILLTGGGGFLGYYFINLFSYLEQNKVLKPAKVTVYDNFIRGKNSWVSNIEKNNTIKIINKDITKFKFSNKYKFDYIIHAASIASPTFYRKYPLETINVNVNGLWNLLEYSKNQKKINKKIKNILYFSSSEIYGDPPSNFIPTNEQYNGNVSCTGPRACYDESKRLGETLCVNYVKKYNLNISIVRPFNNYGPGLDIKDKRVIPDFANNIFSHNDIILYSDGKSKRTFCYISDAIIGYIKILVNGGSGHSYNIGNTKPEITMKQLAVKMQSISKKIFDYKGKVIIKKNKDKMYLIDSPKRRCPDIRKAKNELNYQPKISLETGIKKTLLWYKNNIR